MNSDQFSRPMLAIRMLLVIVALLFLIDMGSFFQSSRVAAASSSIQYKIVVLPSAIRSGYPRTDQEALADMAKDEAALNELGRQGWG
jgi:hypothetical protein